MLVQLSTKPSKVHYKYMYCRNLGSLYVHVRDVAVDKMKRNMCVDVVFWSNSFEASNNHKEGWRVK